MWVPSGWMHETCGVEDFSVGLGGITFEGADVVEAGQKPACLHDRFGMEYALDEVPYCRKHADACKSLPTSTAGC